MKILFITEKFPYPLDSGGRIRTYQILRGLAQAHQITLLTTLENEAQRTYLPELAKVCQNVCAIPIAHETPLRLGWKIFKNLFSAVPIVVERHYFPAVAAEIRRQITQAQPAFDAVHFDHLDASIYLADVPEAIATVLDEHNIVSNQVKTSIPAERNLLKRWYMQFQLRQTLRYETAVCAKMTRCFVCSDTDKTYLQGMARKAQVVTIPNGVDVDYFSERLGTDEPASEAGPLPNSLIFVGTLDYGPGETAMRYFCQEILPIIRNSIPEIRFWAVGQNPPKYLQSLAEQDHRIIVTGRVEDIRPYVLRAQVFVVPLKSGSGTRLKILAAMAMGIPVVSTSIGAEGLAVRSGEQLLLADTPEAFSAAVLQILQDTSLAHALRENALRFVREKYAWPKIWADLRAAYRELERAPKR